MKLYIVFFVSFFLFSCTNEKSPKENAPEPQSTQQFLHSYFSNVHISLASTKEKLFSQLGPSNFSELHEDSPSSPSNSTPLTDLTTETNKSQKQTQINPGHSSHGNVFDYGARKKAILMPHLHINLDFPITTKNPEVQKYFNQGIVLLHGYWFYEAERTFRTIISLEPENPMGYWGASMANSLFFAGDLRRANDFLREAYLRVHNASPQEAFWNMHFLRSMKTRAQAVLYQDDKNLNNVSKNLPKPFLIPMKQKLF